MSAAGGVREMADRTKHHGNTMKALVQEGYGSADVLHVRDIPRPELMEGRVLGRMRAASVNALDWHTTHGGLLLEIVAKIMRQQDEPVRGVDLAGTVEAVGPNVTRFKPGDEVFGGAPASFAEYVRAREDRLLLKPRDLPFEAGRDAGRRGTDRTPGSSRPRAGQAGTTGAHPRRGRRCRDVRGADREGARRARHRVTGPQNVDITRSLGVDEVIDYTKEDFARRPERYDAVIDISATRSLSDLRRVLTPNGMFVQVGAPKSGGWIGVFARIINVMVRARVLRQRVKFYVAQTNLEDLAYLKDLIEAGKLRPMIDRTYPLSEAREAVRYVGTGQARAKVVITG
jgi:NADPH:quinone reductase-like Zn-dependent oxidoreductase